MTLNLTPTPDDIADAHDVLARNPGVETAAILGAIGGELTAAKRAADADNAASLALALRRAVALEEAHRAWAPDIRLVRRRAIQRNGRAA